MPKLPVVSGQKAVKALSKLGFEAVRQRGSHVVMKGRGRTFAVPLHPELDRDTLRAISGKPTCPWRNSSMLSEGIPTVDAGGNEDQAVPALGPTRKWTASRQGPRDGLQLVPREPAAGGLRKPDRVFSESGGSDPRGWFVHSLTGQ